MPPQMPLPPSGKIKNLKAVRKACVEIVQLLFSDKDVRMAIYSMLENHLYYWYDEKANLDEICKDEMAYIINYINNTFEQPIIPDEVIQDYYDKIEELKEKKLNGSKYNLNNSRINKTFYNTDNSAFKSTWNWNGSQNTTIPQDNTELKAEDLEYEE